MKIPKKSSDSGNLPHYMLYSPLNRPIFPPIFVDLDTYTRILRSPTPSSRSEDFPNDPASINTFQSCLSIDTYVTVATAENQYDEIASPTNKGYAQERFINEIDDYFKCLVCLKIVNRPLECIYCQNLMCKSCITNCIKCPYGCEFLSVNNPSKFAFMSYLKFKIKCCYSKSGCEFVCSIKDIAEHEKECEFAELKCANPVCSEVFIKKNKDKHDSGICSEICRIVVDYKNALETDSEDLLGEFIKIIGNTKEFVQSEIATELDELFVEAEQKKNEVEEFLIEKEKLYNEIDEWRNRYHSGKWNHVIRWWTCCENKEKYSIGCVYIG